MYLFKNPMFHGNMELQPYKRFLKATGERLVDQPMSGNYYNDLQVSNFNFQHRKLFVPYKVTDFRVVFPPSPS